jgi:ribosomal protein S18 acetylase RimI-like enzyme
LRNIVVSNLEPVSASRPPVIGGLSSRVHLGKGPGSEIFEMEFTLRPVTPDDLPFLWALRESAMRPNYEPVEGWDDAVQRQRAAESLTGRLVLVDGEPVGVLTVKDRGHELHLTWIAVLPALQGRGLGTALVRLAQAEASAAGRPLSLHVQPANPARRLYERLGFELDELILGGKRARMVWTPGPDAVS